MDLFLPQELLSVCTENWQQMLSELILVKMVYFAFDLEISFLFGYRVATLLFTAQEKVGLSKSYRVKTYAVHPE